MRSLDFHLYPLRFHFLALEPIRFPEGKAGNVFRGALGSQLQAAPDEAVYTQLFAPVSAGAGPSGFEKRPRPFVLRASHLDGRTVPAGDPFHVDLHLFLVRPGAPDPISHLTKAFANLDQHGLGAGRGRVKFAGVTRIDVPDSPVDIHPLTLLLAPAAVECSAVQIHFRTPTELKHDGRIVERPEFGVLFNRVRDRIATLRALYGDGPLSVDFCAMAERAALVRLDRCSLTPVNIERPQFTHRSDARPGRVHR